MAVHRRHVEVTSPCPIELDPSRGSKGEKGWYCGHCDKSVHVLSNLTEREARELLAAKVGAPIPEPMPTPRGGLSAKVLPQGPDEPCDGPERSG